MGAPLVENPLRFFLICVGVAALVVIYALANHLGWIKSKDADKSKPTASAETVRDSLEGRREYAAQVTANMPGPGLAIAEGHDGRILRISGGECTEALIAELLEKFGETFRSFNFQTVTCDDEIKKVSGNVSAGSVNSYSK